VEIPTNTPVGIREAIDWQAGVLERFPCQFEQQPLLWIDERGLRRNPAFWLEPVNLVRKPPHRDAASRRLRAAR
jgi:hypothetical protein